MNPILDFLRSDGSIITNKRLAHAIGLHEAIMYSDLISKHHYFENKSQIDNGYFYNTAENIFRDTTLTAKQQRSAIKELERLGLVKTKIKGIPAVKYFMINQNLENLARLLTEGKQLQQLGTKGTTSIAEMSQQCKQKGNGNNTKHDTNHNNKIYITLTSDEHFLSFYLSAYMDLYGKQHPRVEESSVDTIESALIDIQDSLSYEEYCDMIIEYFEQLPKNNNGNILSFITAKDRYLLNGQW